mgnify:CR=1 FL=1
MRSLDYDFIIVGSGAGGSTLGWELAKKGMSVLLIERGHDIKKVGQFRDILKFYDLYKYTKTPKKSQEGVILYRTFMPGGTTVVSTGNGVTGLENKMSEIGINIEEEMEETIRELKVLPSSEKIHSNGSEAIYNAARDLGYMMEPMPKFIDQNKCVKCGMCVFGCKNNAKWTAKNYLDKADKLGVQIEYNSKVERVIIKDNIAIGVEGIDNDGVFKYFASNIILAAGGLGTPVIIKNSNIYDNEVGENLFVDIFVNVYGIANGINQTNEPPMEFVDSEFHDSDGFIISSFINRDNKIRFIEAGLKGYRFPNKKLIGMMIKIVDESSGKVFSNGIVSKPVKASDWEKLNKGIEISKEILIKAGADENSILVSNPQGAHPGGTAAIGKFVDNKLHSKINNLYVCDGSVFPESPGLPPIITIVALAKRLAKSF